MKMCIRFLGMLILLVAQVALAQDYTTYYQLINSAEEKFVLQRDTSCFADYDLAFSQYQPFLKDPYIAAQIALSVGDTLRFYHYLQICFENGMPISAIDASPRIMKDYHLAMSMHIADLYKRSYREKSYEDNYLHEICMMCYQSDSIKLVMGSDPVLNRRYDAQENRARKYILENFLVKGMFPNERLIGITTDKSIKEFHRKNELPDVYLAVTGRKGHDKEERELRRKCPYNIVLHARCFYRDHKPLFIEAMKNGYIHPKELGILEETSMIWHQNDQNPESTCDPAEIKIGYNIFGNSPLNPTIKTFTTSVEGLQVVEANRKEIYMQKYSVDLLKKQMEKEQGFKFFFDFKDR